MQADVDGKKSATIEVPADRITDSDEKVCPTTATFVIKVRNS